MRRVARWFLSFPAGILYCLAASGLHEALGSSSAASELAALLASMFVGSNIAAWVMGDAERRRRSLPYDFDSFVFCAWWVVAPVYIFRTRGWRALITIGWFALLYFVAVLVAIIPWLIYGASD